MVLNYRIDDEIVIFTNFGGLLNDPRHFDAGRDVKDILAQGYRKFVLELRGIREMGSTGMGLLMTLTRQIRQSDGEAVLASLSPAMAHYLDEMQMEDYWDVFDSVGEAERFLRRDPE